MIAAMSHPKAWSRHKALPRAAIVVALLALGAGLAGCASSVGDVGDSMSLAFVDPARYDYYSCKQLQADRKANAAHIADIKKLMEKADTGFAGPVVAELAYRNDYVAFVAQSKLADQTWERNKCHEVPEDPPAAAVATPAPNAKGTHGGPSRSGSAVY